MGQQTKWIKVDTLVTIDTVFMRQRFGASNWNLNEPVQDVNGKLHGVLCVM